MPGIGAICGSPISDLSIAMGEMETILSQRLIRVRPDHDRIPVKPQARVVHVARARRVVRLQREPRQIRVPIQQAQES